MSRQILFFPQDYTSGALLTGYLKKELIDLLQPICRNHREARVKVTDEVLNEFMLPRPLTFKKAEPAATE